MLKEVLKLLGLPETTTEDQALEAMKAKFNQAASQEVMSALCLGPSTSTQVVVGAIQALKAGVAGAAAAGNSMVACTEIMSELGLAAAANKSEALATLRALKQPQVAGVSIAEFQAMKDRLAKMDADGLVTEAMKAGKITAAQKDWAEQYAKTDPSGFKIFTEKAPVVVVMKEVGGSGGNNDPGPTGSEITESDRVVMKQMGISEEEFKKFNRPA